jgi:hypothetical protein
MFDSVAAMALAAMRLVKQALAVPVVEVEIQTAQTKKRLKLLEAAVEVEAVVLMVIVEIKDQRVKMETKLMEPQVQLLIQQTIVVLL